MFPSCEYGEGQEGNIYFSQARIAIIRITTSVSQMPLQTHY